MAQLQGLPPGVPRLAVKNKTVPQGQRVPTHVLFDVRASLLPNVYDLDVGDMAGNLTSTFASREGPQEQPVATSLEVRLEYSQSQYSEIATATPYCTRVGGQSGWKSRGRSSIVT